MKLYLANKLNVWHIVLNNYFIYSSLVFIWTFIRLLTTPAYGYSEYTCSSTQQGFIFSVKSQFRLRVLQYVQHKGPFILRPSVWSMKDLLKKKKKVLSRKKPEDKLQRTVPFSRTDRHALVCPEWTEEGFYSIQSHTVLFSRMLQALQGDAC